MSLEREKELNLFKPGKKKSVSEVDNIQFDFSGFKHGEQLKKKSLKNRFKNMFIDMTGTLTLLMTYGFILNHLFPQINIPESDGLSLLMLGSLVAGYAVTGFTWLKLRQYLKKQTSLASPLKTGAIAFALLTFPYILGNLGEASHIAVDNQAQIKIAPHAQPVQPVYESTTPTAQHVSANSVNNSMDYPQIR